MLSSSFVVILQKALVGVSKVEDYPQTKLVGS